MADAAASVLGLEIDAVGQAELIKTGEIALCCRKIFERSTDFIVDILRKYRDPSDIEESVGVFWRYRLAGLQALLQMDNPEPESNT